MALDIKQWAAPVQRGRRTYDDKAFVASLQKQFAAKGTLSERQVAALARTLVTYKDQIENFKARCAELAPEAFNGKENSAEESDVLCPKCGKRKMVKKHWRRRTFYGCGAYPECKYTDQLSG